MMRKLLLTIKAFLNINLYHHILKNMKIRLNLIKDTNWNLSGYL